MIGVAEEGPARAEAGAEGGADRRGIDADRDEAGVTDLGLVLQRDHPAEEALLLRAPPAAEELQHGGVLAGKLLQPAGIAVVVGQLEVGEGVAGREGELHHAATAGAFAVSSASAKWKLSVNAGKGWIVSSMTSIDTPARIASTACCIHSPASGPSACAPVRCSPSETRVRKPGSSS